MSKNPLDDYFEEKEAMEDQRRQQDYTQWETWKNNGQQPHHLEPLIQRFQPLMNQAMTQWRAPKVQKSAFEAELKKHMIHAFETYDPSKAALATHVTNRIRKIHRYNAKHQNMAYIPEGQIKEIRHIQRAQNDLREDLERDPTRTEIAEHLGMSDKKLTRIMTSMKKDIFASQFETDPTKSTTSREHEVLDLIEPNLSHEEKQVFNHLYGREGAKQINTTNELAAALGKNPSQVSRIRTSLLNKVKSYT